MATYHQTYYVKNVQSAMNIIDTTTDTTQFVVDPELGEEEYRDIERLVRSEGGRITIANARPAGALYAPVLRIHVSTVQDINEIVCKPGQQVLVHIRDEKLTQSEYDIIFKHAISRNFFVVNKYGERESRLKIKFHGSYLQVMAAGGLCLLSFYWCRMGCPPLNFGSIYSLTKAAWGFVFNN